MLNEIHGDTDWKTSLRSFNNDEFYPFDKTGDVAELKVATLCMMGEQQELEVSSTVRYKQLNSNINISVIPFVGHLVHRDQPDLFTQTLHTFIRNVK